MMRTCAEQTSKRDPYRLPPNIDYKICGKPSIKEGESVCKYHLTIRNNQMMRQLGRSLNKGRITKAEYDEHIIKLESFQ